MSWSCRKAEMPMQHALPIQTACQCRQSAFITSLSNGKYCGGWAPWQKYYSAPGNVSETRRKSRNTQRTKTEGIGVEICLSPVTFKISFHLNTAGLLFYAFIVVSAEERRKSSWSRQKTFHLTTRWGGCDCSRTPSEQCPLRNKSCYATIESCENHEKINIYHYIHVCFQSVYENLYRTCCSPTRLDVSDTLDMSLKRSMHEKVIQEKRVLRLQHHQCNTACYNCYGDVTI